jgi:beta-glucanase (GH16 family)
MAGKVLRGFCSKNSYFSYYYSLFEREAAIFLTKPIFIMFRPVLGAMLVLWLFFSCSSKNTMAPAKLPPTNLMINTSITPDSSGNITISFSATNAVSYTVILGDGNVKTSTTGSLNYKYAFTGNYTISITATSADGETINGTAQANVGVKQNLVWSDEFSGTGSPDSTKWGYDIGTGSGGWGNNELEYYTNRQSNVYVSGGTLKIVANKESYNGSNYTSARMLTQNKFSFEYGKIEVRAKIPGNLGAWPAIWMLGNDISTVAWPGCGEIDIMENVGNQQNKIFGTVHFTGQTNGGVGGTTILPTAYTAFHRYAVTWTPTLITFLIDDVPYFSYNNTGDPFNQKFFVILNLAIGGNFGGAVDPTFTTGQMEVDYVRVYQ